MAQTITSTGAMLFHSASTWVPMWVLKPLNIRFGHNKKRQTIQRISFFRSRLLKR